MFHAWPSELDATLVRPFVDEVGGLPGAAGSSNRSADPQLIEQMKTIGAFRVVRRVPLPVRTDGVGRLGWNVVDLESGSSHNSQVSHAVLPTVSV